MPGIINSSNILKLIPRAFLLSSYYSLLFFFFFIVLAVFEENEENFTFNRSLVRPKRLIQRTSVHLSNPTPPNSTYVLFRVRTEPLLYSYKNNRGLK